jgi:hypothetical protein
MNPAASSLRRDQDSMRLADGAHGAVTQLMGHIIAMIDSTSLQRSGSLQWWRSLNEREGCEKDKEDRDARPDTPVHAKSSTSYRSFNAAASPV